MIRYKISIEYNGTLFSGWQKQPNTITVQQTIENAIEKLSSHPVNLVCAGRTDSGVHAIEQVAHFDMIKNFDSFRIQQALNFHLRGKGISVFNVENLGENSTFHARFSALKREYIYKIINRSHPPTFNDFTSWWVPVKLNFDKMNEAAQVLLGTHDFSSFRAQGCQARSPIRTIHNIDFTKKNDLITMHISAPSFLYHQVRNIMGTLYLVGREKLSKESLKEILESKNRAKAGLTAPPFGLYFYKVLYNNE